MIPVTLQPCGREFEGGATDQAEDASMADEPKRKLQGMEVEFVSGVVEERPDDRSIGYTVTFKLFLDFTHFKQMAHLYSANFFDVTTNAIRPQLEGLAAHAHYEVIGAAAGKIINNATFFELFTDPTPYIDGWLNDEMENRYAKPVFEPRVDHLLITAQQYFRWEDPNRQIQISDLPIIPFHWAIKLIEERFKGRWWRPWRKTPVSIVTLMYTQEEVVEIEGTLLLKGGRYLKGNTLSFGPIAPDQVLTA